MAYKTLTDYYIDIVKESAASFNEKEIKEEPLELKEATDLFDTGGITVTRFSMGKGKVGIQLTLDRKVGSVNPTDPSWKDHNYINFSGDHLGRVIAALQAAQKAAKVR